jgi:hypothetical protein
MPHIVLVGSLNMAKGAETSSSLMRDEELWRIGLENRQKNSQGYLGVLLFYGLL